MGHYDLIQQLPKVECHLHIEGTLEPELMFKMAQRNGIPLPYDSPQAVHRAYQFTDLQSFLDLYYQGTQVLVHKQDFYELTLAYLKKAHQDNVVHTEIFFDPQSHSQRGIPLDTVIDGIYEALEEGQKNWGISFRLISCFLRDLGEDKALTTFDTLLPFQDKLDGFGLDSTEIGYPPQNYRRVFEKVHQLGLPVVAHAGEEGPCDYIWQALQALKAQRIDHGVQCIHDASLMAYLKEHQIPLTVCPLSNVKLKVFPELAAHNLKTLLEYGLRVSIHSDDPAYFGGYIAQNYRETQQALGLSDAQVVQLIQNGFLSSWMSQEQKTQWLTTIDQMIESYGALLI